MQSTWYSIKGFLMGAIALIACPCHLPLTLPLIIGITGGTVVGGWLSRNTTLIYAASTIAFLIGLGLAFKWLTEERQDPTTKKVGLEADVVLVSSKNCSSCGEADDLWRGLQEKHSYKYSKVDIQSRKGRSIAAEHNIMTTPTTLVNGRVAFRGVPGQVKASMIVR